MTRPPFHLRAVDARETLDHARTDLDQTLAKSIELSLCERVCLRNGLAYGKHQPISGSVKHEPHLIGRRAVTRHAVRRHLRLVQFDQVLHLSALAVLVLIEVLRRPLEGGDYVADIYLLTHAVCGGPSKVGLQRTLQPRHNFARTCPGARLITEAGIGPHLLLRTFGMMDDQIVGDRGYLLVKHWVARKAKNVVGIAIFFYPLHRLNAPVMSVAAPHDASVGPTLSQELSHVLDDGPHLRALRGARRVGLAWRILHSRNGGLRGQRVPGLRTAAYRELHQRIVPQPVKVVRILVSARDRRRARHQHLVHRMQDAVRITVIRYRCRKPLAHTTLALRLAQQQ